MAHGFDRKKRLGSGSFGEVWHAKEIGLDSDCALKCIPVVKVVNQANLFAEAQILKASEHPNVVKIFETGMLDKDNIYISMEFLPKGSLEDEASGGFVAISRAKKIMIDILRGLEHLHSKNIIHRDIKPANILIGNNGEGKLSDFGLAMKDLSTLDQNVIKTHYKYFMHLAPEVQDFQDFTEQSDIFAAGITFYRIVNGDTYLPMYNPFDIRDEIENGKFPDRKKYREFVPQRLRVILNKAMSVDTDKRYNFAEEFRRDIEQIPLVHNWNERTLVNGFEWTAHHRDSTYLVTRIHAKGKWSVETKKGPNKQSLRRIGSLCNEFNEKSKAISFTKRVLQDFVLGRED